MCALHPSPLLLTHTRTHTHTHIQNPPGAYAGRKALSRAFRSRFLELHIEDIPDSELAEILEKRCALAPSYASKLVWAVGLFCVCVQGCSALSPRHGVIGSNLS